MLLSNNPTKKKTNPRKLPNKNAITLTIRSAFAVIRTPLGEKTDDGVKVLLICMLAIR